MRALRSVAVETGCLVGETHEQALAEVVGVVGGEDGGGILETAAQGVEVPGGDVGELWLAGAARSETGADFEYR